MTKQNRNILIIALVISAFLLLCCCCSSMAALAQFSSVPNPEDQQTDYDYYNNYYE